VPFPPGLEARYLPGPEYVRAQIDFLIDSGRLPTPWWETEGLGA
jgi:hypothetical protein